MKDRNEREAFYSQSREEISSLLPDNPCKFYKLLESGQTVCEIELDLGVGEDAVEIAQITDCHVNSINGRDLKDPETPYTYKCRTAFRDRRTVAETVSALAACEYSDATVVTGDILDYMTISALDDVRTLFVEKYPDIMMTLGWHDMTKQMQTKRPNLISDEERIAILQQIWPHDIHYYSRDLGKRVTVICLGMTIIAYSKDFSEQLLADIKRSREENRYILIFQHEPLATRLEKDREVTPSFTRTDGYGVLRNFCDGDRMIAGSLDTNAQNLKIYDIIRSNADVIKGIFAGHYHNQFYTEIPAWYERDGVRVECSIPQHVAHIVLAKDRGYLVRIKVK